MPFKIAPSILSADFGNLAQQVTEAEQAGADWIHVDVMDGMFVPNITIGPLVVKAVRKATSLPLDVHLMIVQPERYIEAFAQAGADMITFHAEATPHIHRAIQLIHSLNCRAGLAINPLTPVEFLRDALGMLDLVLIMTVNPGFGGQTFIEESLVKIRIVRQWRDERGSSCEIEVDGGVSPATIQRIASAGANIFVAGNAVFNSTASIADNIAALRSQLSLLND